MQQQIFETSQETPDFCIENAKLDTFYNHLSQWSELGKDCDIVVPANSLTFRDGQLLAPTFEFGETSFGTYDDITKHARQQIHEKFDVPNQYATRLLSNDRLHIYDYTFSELAKLAAAGGKEKNFLLRAYRKQNSDDGSRTLRAFLSGQYYIMDNLPVIEAVLTTLKEVSDETGVQIVCTDCSLTEQSMYARFVCPEIEMKSWAIREYRNPATGDRGNGGICSGFVVTNSEVGSSAFSISPRLVVDACKNGMIWKNEGFRMTHLGAKLESGVVTWSQETQKRNRDLIVSQVRDAVKRFVSRDFLGKTITEIETAASQKISHPFNAIQGIGREYLIPKSKIEEALNFFTRQGSTETAFDVVQAFTFVAQKMDSDSRWEIESKVPEMLKNVAKFDVEAKV